MPNIKPTQPSFEKQIKPVDKAVENKTQVKTDKLSQSINEKKAGEKATLNPAEKVAIGAAAAAIGGVAGAAAAAVCLVDDDVLDKVKDTGSKMKEGIKEHYKHSPEEKAFDSVKKFGKQAGEAIEEFVDDVKDGRVARDVSKSAKRFVRDHFTEQSKTDKFSNLVKDAAQDLKDAASDLADDIKDGRIKGKIN